MQKRPPTTIWDLPKEMLMDIVARLPVKFILRCRCVCKHLRTLLVHTRFIKLHLERSILRTPNLLLFSHSTPASLQSYLGDLHIQTVDSELLHQCKTLIFELRRVEVALVCSCNGLLCLSDFKKVMFLCNPSTRETIKVQFDYTPESKLLMGFGYDPFTEQYKVVKAAFRKYDGKCIQVRIYTLDTNSWKTVDDVPLNFCLDKSYLNQREACGYLSDESFTRNVHVDGVVYWDRVGKDKFNSTVAFLDLRNEKFGEVSWPGFGDECRYRRLGVFEEHVAAFCKHKGHVDVWMVNVMKNSWNKILSIPEQRNHLTSFDPSYSLRPFLVRKNREFLLQINSSNLLLYDPVNNTSRVPIIRGLPPHFCTATYVEALTSIASLMARTRVKCSERQKRTRPTESKKRKRYNPFAWQL